MIYLSNDLLNHFESNQPIEDQGTISLPNIINTSILLNFTKLYKSTRFLENFLNMTVLCILKFSRKGIKLISLFYDLFYTFANTTKRLELK